MNNTPRVLVLDTGALIALERVHPVMTGILARLKDGRARIVISEAVVAQVWRGGSGRQARLSALLGLRSEYCTFVPLGREAAKRIGRAIGASGHADVVDTHVATLAVDLQAGVVTSDRDDILKIAPELHGRILDV